MTLTDSWSQALLTSSVTATFTVPNNVPIGSLLVVAVGRGGTATAITAASSIRSNPWVIEATGAQATLTLNVALLSMEVTTALVAGDTFTVTANVTSNRWALAAGVFDDFVSPPNKEVTGTFSSASQFVSAGPTGDLAVERALVVTAVATTGNGYPIANSGNALAAQVLAGASAQRGVALLYKTEGGYPHTGQATLFASVISVSATAAYECAPLPDGSLPVMTADGEVAGVLTVWDGAVEIPVSSIEVAA